MFHLLREVTLTPRSFQHFNSQPLPVFSEFNYDLVNSFPKRYEYYFDYRVWNYFKLIVSRRKNAVTQVREARHLLKTHQSAKDDLIIQRSSVPIEWKKTINEKISYLDLRCDELFDRINSCDEVMKVCNAELIALVYFPMIEVIFAWKDPLKLFTMDTILLCIYFYGNFSIPKRFAFFIGDYKKLCLPKLRSEIPFHPILMEIERLYVHSFRSLSREISFLMEHIFRKKDKQMVTFLVLIWREWRDSQNNLLEKNETLFYCCHDVLLHTLQFLYPGLQLSHFS